MIKRIDSMILGCLLLLMLALPVSTAGVEVFSSLAAILFLVKQFMVVRAGGRFFATVPDSVLVPVLAFFSVAAVSICFSGAWDLGPKALIGKTLQGVLLLGAVIDVATTRRRILSLFGMFAAGSFLVGVDGLWQLGQGVDFLRGRVLDAGRVAASMKHPNDLGAYLIFAVIISMGFLLWAWFEAGKENILMKLRLGMAAAGLLVVLLVVLGVTYSRGAWLGALAAVLVFVMVRRKYVWVCMGIVVIFAALFLPRMMSARNVSFISDNAKEASVASINQFTGSDRLNMWKDAVRIIKDHPFLGTGLNTYTRVIYSYSQSRKLYPHNSYLQMAAETGLVGVGTFFWLLAAVGWFVYKRIILLKDGLSMALMAGLFAAWIGFLVQSGLDTNFYSVQLSCLLWFVMGLLVAGSIFIEKDGRKPAEI